MQYGTPQTLSVSDCTISGNSAGTDCGGLDASQPATLEDTIVAGNLGTGDADIGGPFAVAVTGSYNLIGPGGSGGIQGGNDGNIVLASLTGLGLARAGRLRRTDPDHGPPTRQPRPGAGTSVTGISADQRGELIGPSV